MSSPNRGISPAFRFQSGKLARRPAIVVQFRDSEGGTPIARFSMGAVDGAQPTLVGVNPIPSRFRISTLSHEIGDVTIDITTAGPGLNSPTGGLSIANLPELFAQTPKAARIADVLYGFQGMAFSDYMLLWSGNVSQFPRLNGSSYSIIATDGMNRLSNVLYKDIPVPDLWSDEGYDRNRPFFLSGNDAARLMSDIMVAAAGGDENEAIPDEDIDAVNAANRNNLEQALRDINIQNIDHDLTRHVLVNHVMKYQDPKTFAEESLLPIMGGFLARTNGSQNRIRELKPQNRDYNYSRGEWRNGNDAVFLSDNEIIPGTLNASISYDDCIMSINVDFGLQVWDPYQGDNKFILPIPNMARDYENPMVHQYTMHHTFEALPYLSTGKARPHSSIMGRSVKICSPWTFQTQADPSDEELFGGAVATTANPFTWKPARGRDNHMRDIYGFPITYQGFRKSWEDPDDPVGRWSVRMGGSNNQREQFDWVHHLHNQVARLMKFGFSTHMKVSCSVPARIGSTMSIGDGVKLWSKHIPNTKERKLGVGSGDPINAQVLEVTPNPQAGSVQLGLCAQLPDPDHESKGTFLELENEIAHTSPFPFDLNRDRVYARYVAPGSERKTRRGEPGDENSAVYWLTDEDGSPRVREDEIYGFKFHYIRFGLEFSVKAKNVTVGSPHNRWARIGFTVSLVGNKRQWDDTFPGESHALCWSTRRELWVQLAVDDFGTGTWNSRYGEISDSIMIPGLKKGRGKLRRDGVFSTIYKSPSGLVVRNNVGEPNEAWTVQDDTKDIEFQFPSGIEEGDIVVFPYYDQYFYDDGNKNQGPFFAEITEVIRAVPGFPARLKFEPIDGFAHFLSASHEWEHQPFDVRKPINSHYSDQVGLDHPFLSHLDEDYESIDPDMKGIAALKVDLEDIVIGRPQEDPTAEIEDNFLDTNIRLRDVEFHRLRWHVDDRVIIQPPPTLSQGEL